MNNIFMVVISEENRVPEPKSIHISGTWEAIETPI